MKVPQALLIRLILHFSLFAFLYFFASLSICISAVTTLDPNFGASLVQLGVEAVAHDNDPAKWPGQKTEKTQISKLNEETLPFCPGPPKVGRGKMAKLCLKKTQYFRETISSPHSQPHCRGEDSEEEEDNQEMAQSRRSSSSFGCF